MHLVWAIILIAEGACIGFILGQMYEDRKTKQKGHNDG